MNKPVPSGDFDHQHKIMSMFSDNAKTYIQLSGAALALTLTFANEILRIPKNQNVATGWMMFVWACFLVAIVSGAFYQYLAVKWLERGIDADSYNLWKSIEPGWVYGLMLGAFYGGAIVFTIYAMMRLRNQF